MTHLAQPGNVAATSPDLSQIHHQERRKFSILLFAAATAVALLAGCALRFLSPLNDRVSGPFEPLHWIADRMAREVAFETRGEFPVLALPATFWNCTSGAGALADDNASIYYVFVYAEGSDSLCMMSYVPSSPNNPGAQTVDLRKAQGYAGQSFPASIVAVPMGHAAIRFPPAYIALLNWRTSPNAQLLAKASKSRLEKDVGVAGPMMDANVSLNLNDLRSAIAHRHSAVNEMLDSAIAIFAALFFTAFLVVWFSYRQFCLQETVYGCRPKVPEYLFSSLPALADEHRRNWFLQQREMLQRQRAANLAERSKDAGKPSIRLVLREPTLDERIGVLLQSLRDFCSPEEFSSFSAEAIVVLRERGFRPAREYAVRMHDQLRERARSALNEENDTVTGEQVANRKEVNFG
jgi:hypothetical protein